MALNLVQIVCKVVGKKLTVEVPDDFQRFDHGFAKKGTGEIVVSGLTAGSTTMITQEFLIVKAPATVPYNVTYVDTIQKSGMQYIFEV